MNRPPSKMSRAEQRANDRAHVHGSGAAEREGRDAKRDAEARRRRRAENASAKEIVERLCSPFKRVNTGREKLQVLSQKRRRIANKMRHARRNHFEILREFVGPEKFEEFDTPERLREHVASAAPLDHGLPRVTPEALEAKARAFYLGSMQPIRASANDPTGDAASYEQHRATREAEEYARAAYYLRHGEEAGGANSEPGPFEDAASPAGEC